MNPYVLYNIDEELIKSYRDRQARIAVDQLKNRSFDSLSDLFDSSAHFWLNEDPGDYPLHWHPTIEIIIPVENNYTAIIEHKTYDLAPGDIFIIPGGKLHHLVAPATGIRFILIFDLSMLSEVGAFASLTSWLTQPILINRETCRPIYDEETALVAQLLRDYQNADILRETLIYNKLITFVTNYVRYQLSLNKNAFASSPARRVRNNHITAFNTVIDYLDNHYTEELSLEKVANIAGFSKFHFSRLFKEFTGDNFYNYIMYKRIKLAEILLAQPDNHITEIAMQCGFSSLSTFNRTFRKLKGCTPSEYRKLINA